MPSCKLTYFVSDVHLGLDFNDPADREQRFVDFLKGLSAETTSALYLLGDIWDFWYEYHDVVPKGYARVFAQFIRLIDEGVDVYFFKGNHDMWTFGYLESLGIKVLEQPYYTEIDGQTFCLGHGDGLGDVPRSYTWMHALFNSRVAQGLLSLLHPRITFWIGRNWSGVKRKSRKHRYHFKGEREPLYHFANAVSARRHVDYFIFGHYHSLTDMPVENGGRLLILDDWLDESNYLYFGGMYGLGKSSK